MHHITSLTNWCACHCSSRPCHLPQSASTEGFQLIFVMLSDPLPPTASSPNSVPGIAASTSSSSSTLAQLVADEYSSAATFHWVGAQHDPAIELKRILTLSLQNPLLQGSISTVMAKTARHSLNRSRDAQIVFPQPIYKALASLQCKVFSELMDLGDAQCVQLPVCACHNQPMKMCEPPQAGALAGTVGTCAVSREKVHAAALPVVDDALSSSCAVQVGPSTVLHLQVTTPLFAIMYSQDDKTNPPISDAS
jgi:hypothetical protein